LVRNIRETVTEKEQDCFSFLQRWVSFDDADGRGGGRRGAEMPADKGRGGETRNHLAGFQHVFKGWTGGV